MADKRVEADQDRKFLSREVGWREGRIRHVPIGL
jgi:hypothetical protein